MTKIPRKVSTLIACVFTASLWPWLTALCLWGSVAHAGSVDAQADIDVFHADSRSSASGSGSPTLMTAQEVGLNARIDAKAFDDKLHFRLHYRGREPVFGSVRNQALRTLQEAKLQYTFFHDAVTAAVGRFGAQGPIALVVDGGVVTAKLPAGFSLGAFGGRRGLTGARREAGYQLWLPVLGLDAGWENAWLQAAMHVNYAQDQAIFLKARSENTQNVGGFNGLMTLDARPIETLFVGVMVSGIQQANYTIGPSWNAVDVEMQIVNWFGAALWTQLRPLKWMRLTYDIQLQRPAVVRSGTLEGEDATLSPELVDPRYLDNRVRIALSPFEFGWLRAGARHRLRPDRHELRGYAEIDVDNAIPVGIVARGRIAYQMNIARNGAPDASGLNRFLGLLEVGYEGYGFEGTTGLSYIERSGAPLSSRVAQAQQPVDLSPFVLAAQQIFFLRAAYHLPFAHVAFAVERNLRDNEYRVFAQVGGRMELTWE